MTLSKFPKRKRNPLNLLSCKASRGEVNSPDVQAVLMNAMEFFSSENFLKLGVPGPIINIEFSNVIEITSKMAEAKVKLERLEEVNSINTARVDVIMDEGLFEGPSTVLTSTGSTPKTPTGSIRNYQTNGDDSPPKTPTGSIRNFETNGAYSKTNTPTGSIPNPETNNEMLVDSIYEMLVDSSDDILAGITNEMLVAGISNEPLDGRIALQRLYNERIGSTNTSPAGKIPCATSSHQASSSKTPLASITRSMSMYTARGYSYGIAQNPLCHGINPSSVCDLVTAAVVLGALIVFLSNLFKKPPEEKKDDFPTF